MKCIIALCACIQYQIHFESHLNESVQIYPASSICKQVATTIGTLTPDPSVPWTREEWYTQLLVADCPTYETLTLMMKHAFCGWLSTGLHLQLGQVRTAKNSSYVRKTLGHISLQRAATLWYRYWPNQTNPIIRIWVGILCFNTVNQWEIMTQKKNTEKVSRKLFSIQLVHPLYTSMGNLWS